MKKRLEFLIKFFTVFTFFIPLLFLPRYFIFPFVVPKVIAFRILVLVLLGAYTILLSLHWSRFKPKLTPINIIVGLFILSFSISTFFGVDSYRSFWDNHERMLGLFSVLHYVIYYYILSSVVTEWKDWKWLMRFFMIGGSLVMLIAAMQRIDPDFFLNKSGSRTSSSLGNPIYVGGYGLFMSAIGWLLYVKENHDYWKWFAAFAGLLGVLGIFFSGSRGAFLGFAAGIFFLLLSYVLANKKNEKLKKGFFAFVILGAVAFGALWMFRDSTFVDKMPSAVARLVRDPLKATSTRPMAWGIAIKSWTEKPILGWGPSNFYYAFNTHYRPEFLRFGYGETWFDNAHNIALNTLAERGLLGVVIFFGIYGVTIYYLWQAYKKEKIDIHIVAVGTAFFLAHLVQTVSVFENPTSYLYFFFTLAFLNSQISKEKITNSVGSAKVDLSVGVTATTTLVILLLIYSTNINPARANMATIVAIRETHSLFDSRGAYDYATSIPTPHIDDIRNDYGRAVSANLHKYVQANKSPLAQNLFEVANEGYNKNKELHPGDVRIHAQQSIMLQTVANLSGNKVHLLEAESVAEEALQISPKRQQLIFTLAGIKVQLQKVDEARALYQQSIDDDPRIGEGWWRLALLENAIGNKEKSIEILDEAKEKKVSFTEEGLNVENQIRASVLNSTIEQ